MSTPAPGGALRLADDLTISRIGYGAMQLAGPGVFGPPNDRDQALAVLREAVELGITHIDTSDFYGPFVVNDLIKEALYPYPDDLHIVTKVGARRGDDGSWIVARSPDDLVSQVHENLKRLNPPSTWSIFASAQGSPPQTTPSPTSSARSQTCRSKV
jgi:aryl-alcohol dehydrogenase-like predicted oxidoreductase